MSPQSLRATTGRNLMIILQKARPQCGAPRRDGGRVFFNFSRKKAGFNESGRMLSMN
jgi:hypothetical protein